MVENIRKLLSELDNKLNEVKEEIQLINFKESKKEYRQLLIINNNIDSLQEEITEYQELKKWI